MKHEKSGIEVSEMRGMPHTVKVERHQNELVVHVALLHGPDARLPGGVLLHTEGWVDIGYGLKMFLVIGSGNISYHPKEIEEKKGLLQRLFARRPHNPCWKRSNPQASNLAAYSTQTVSIDHSQCVIVTGNSIVLWTRFKGFDSLNLRKAHVSTWRDVGDAKRIRNEVHPNSRF